MVLESFWKFLELFLIVLGALTLAAGLAFLVRRRLSRRIPRRVILEVDLQQGVGEYAPADRLARIMLSRAPCVLDVYEALERARKDRRVVGLLAIVGAAKMGMAQIQEIRHAVRSFRRSGKPAVAFSETFGEFGPGNGAYFLASAFEEIYLQPSGDLGLTGLTANTPFFKNLLDKLEIVPRLDQRREYKSVMNLFTETGYTPAHREALQAVLDSQFQQILAGIAADRGMDQERLGRLIDRGPFSAAEAVQERLVDGLFYRDEVEDKLKEKSGGAKKLSLLKYLRRAGRLHTKGKNVALIYGVGKIHRGRSRFDLAGGSSTMGSETVTAAFRSAREDRKIRGVLFRVDSPGGSYIASDAVWREVKRTREAGKPVVVSMGNVAGSGGYFVALPADKIVAQPGTVTGSIGVVGGKAVTTGLWEKIGVSWDEAHTSRNAAIWSWTEDYTPQQWQRIGAWLDRIYDDFIDRVAAARALPRARIEEIAKGRIWTGADAHTRGLIDAIGGFSQALQLLREALNLPVDAGLRLRVFPPKRSFLRQLLKRGPKGSSYVASMTSFDTVPGPVQMPEHLAPPLE
jgi:protease-4